MAVYEKDLIYKLWLNLQLDHDHFKADRAIRLFDSAEDIYKTKFFDKKKISRLGLPSLFTFNDKNLDGAKRIMEDCATNNIEMISMDDSRYPQRLRQIDGHPNILYVKGKMPDIDNTVAITIVGSRKCSNYGMDMAHEIAFQLSKCGVLIISGMALGIDGAAHRGALDANCPTLAVVAGGADIIYPSQHRDLYYFILNSGAIIAEEPPKSQIKPFKFPLRNRILAALSMGTLIVEGENSSGSRHTAEYALAYNRDVFALPHNAKSKTGELPNKLISEGSAKITRDAFDILSEYLSEYPDLLSNNIKTDLKSNHRPKQYTPKEPGVSPHKKATNLEDVPQYKSLNNTQQIIVKYIYGKKSVHIDEIIRGCELDTNDVNSAVLLLQMKNMLTELPGKNYTFNTEHIVKITK